MHAMMTDEDHAIHMAIIDRTKTYGFIASLNDAEIMLQRTARYHERVPVCEDCGSENIGFDGICRWDKTAQDWVLVDLYEQRGFCDDCNGEIWACDRFDLKSLHECLKVEGIELDHHETDLYAKDSPAVRRILKLHGKTVDGWNVSRFKSQIDGAHWLDIPFAWRG